jgi:hypothetical protein
MQHDDTAVWQSGGEHRCTKIQNVVKTVQKEEIPPGAGRKSAKPHIVYMSSGAIRLSTTDTTRPVALSLTWRARTNWGECLRHVRHVRTCDTCDETNSRHTGIK